MAEIQIYDMATNAAPDDGDFFEQDIVDTSLPAGRNNKKISLGATAEFIAKTHNYTSGLQTTNKTIVGAINEVLNEGTSVSVTNVLPATDTTKRVATITVDGVAKDVNADDADKILREAFGEHTVTGNPVSVDAFLGLEVPSECKVTMNPIQDLHGYDSPWVGGAGKNKLPLTISKLKSVNTSGTWSENNYTKSGVTFSVITDEGGNVTGIKVNGTASENTYFRLNSIGDLSQLSFDGTYKFNGCLNGSSTTYALQVYANESYTTVVNQYNADASIVSSNTSYTIKEVMIVIRSGYVANNLVFSPMVFLSSVSDNSFAPYENICPISGRTEASVTRTGANQWDEQTQNGYYTPTGIFQSYSGNIATKNKIKVLPNTSYYFKCGSGNYFGRLCWYDANGNFVSTEVVQTANMTKTAPSNAYYLNFDMLGEYGTTYNDDISINYPSTDTNYHAYTAETHTHQYSETIYGGVDDFVSGEGSSTMAMVDLGDITFGRHTTGNFFATLSDAPSTTAEALCSIYKYVGIITSIADLTTDQAFALQPANNRIIVRDTTYTSADDFNASTSGVQLCYKLATPTQITNTPEDITLLKGVNVVSTDGDSLELKYSADIKAYIDSKLNA